METQSEAILLKIKKVKALATNGMEGEKEAALKLLNDLCKKYGVSLDDLEEGEATHEYWVQVRTSVSKLFIQCLAHMFGATERFRADFEEFKCNGHREFRLRMTPTEYIEFNVFFEWHRRNYLEEREKMRDLFFKGYISNHNLYPQETDEVFDEAQKDKPRMTMDEVIAINQMANLCSDKTFHKQLAENGDKDED